MVLRDSLDTGGDFSGQKQVQRGLLSVIISVRISLIKRTKRRAFIVDKALGFLAISESEGCPNRGSRR